MSNPTSREELIKRLKDIDPEEAKKSLIKVFDSYLNPAFGALPKRENQIVMFQVLRDLEIFSENPNLYTIVSSLRVTRSKARNLLYESNLRISNTSNLDSELVELLSEPILLRDSDKVCLEVDNPLLIDHLKHKLKELGHITDGSFSRDLVKLTPVAYKALLNSIFSKISKKKIKTALVECGAEKEITVKSILSGVLKKVGKKVADDAGDQAGELLGDYLGDLFTGGFEKAAEFLKEEIGEEKEVKLV